jgi:hypothetical protein
MPPTIQLLEGRPHLVVPVVAMVGGTVVRGLNSKGYEYVPPDVLAAFPQGLDGRPVVPVHPSNGRGDANNPRAQDSLRFGVTFNSRFDPADLSLKADAWLDVNRAVSLGSQTSSVLARCNAGDTVEISLGAWIVIDEERGVSPGGLPYSYVWKYVISHDHLAVGLGGDVGACSVDMGCGANRYQIGRS